MSFVTQENRVTVHRGQATLPQVFVSFRRNYAQHKNLWERGFARDGGVSGKY